ncbi:MAG: hypothetical protein U5J83_17770 [Bryobacterales bacterium]|nr:hypothetical protein [Bryobacterales bacterium]
MMAQVLRSLVGLLLLILFAMPLSAEKIELNIVYDLRDALFQPTFGSGGNTGLTPFSVQAGDTIDVSFSFARDEYLRFDSLAGAESLEKLSAVLTFLGGNSGAGLALTSSTMTLDVFDGDVQNKRWCDTKRRLCELSGVSGASEFHRFYDGDSGPSRRR